MTIKSGLELYEPKVRVDLLGPDGNVFVLIKTAMVWGRKRGMSQSDVDALRDEMMSDTYDHAIKVFDREFGDMCDLYLPKSSAEQKIVEKTTKVVVKERVEREARRFREAICLNNFGYEDCFEVGLSYRVTRRGNKAMKVEDMMGEVQEVLIERFGEVTEVINEDVEPYNVESDLESLKYCIPLFISSSD